MASYLIVNVALFLSMAFIIHYYICKEPVFKHSPLKWRLILGFSYGCVSMVLMFFRYQVENGLVDLRHLPILLAAFYGGWASAIPAWIVASVARFFLLNQLGSYSIPILILALDAIMGVVLPQMIRSHHFKWVITRIPKDRINKLGEPFYSLKEKGTGLGITICKKIIQNHNGDISFHSKLGEGTVVHLTLPLS